MSRIAVELAGTSPTLHNHCVARYETLGRVPKDDREQAESRLFKSIDRGLYLPWWTPAIAIGRAAWSKHRRHGARWPRDIVHAEANSSLLTFRMEFRGEWLPQRFNRPGLPPVALPRFDHWGVSFDLEYDPHYYDEPTLRSLLEHSGRHLGLPQFAPFAGPGPWGRFEIAKWEPAERPAARETALV